MKTRSIWMGLETEEIIKFCLQLESAGVTPEDILRANKNPLHFRDIGEKIVGVEYPAMAIEENSGAITAKDLHLL